MSKPDDVPQSVLSVAEEAYQQAIYMTTSDEPQNMVLMVARAIMAERERCAKIAGDYPTTRMIDGPQIATRIRKGTP